MRKICILVFILICSATLFAQKNESQNSSMEKKVDGFVIFIRPAPGPTFLFDILKNGQVMYRQTNNPFTLQPEGFEKKEDAFKVAEWLVNEYKTTQHFPPNVPPHVADLYKIKVNRGTRANQN